MDLSEAAKIRNPENVVRHPWEIARLKIITFLLSKQKKLPFQHILDIGTGDGFILQHLIQHGAALDFSAVDPAFNDTILNSMKTWPDAENLRIYKEISEISPNSGAIDCILLLDVLEHVADDNKLITEIFRYAPVAKGAKWVITVPAFQKLFSMHDKQLKHYRRYTLKQLLSLCEKCGLKIDESGYFFFSLIPIRIIQKLLLKFRKKDHLTTIENWKGGIGLSKSIQAALWIDFRISLLLGRLKINIPGLSCYCICH